MQKPLRNTTLLSLFTLLGLSASQSTSVTWGTPFSVDGPSGTGTPAPASASTEALLSSSPSNQPLTNPLRTSESFSTGSDVTRIEGTRTQSSFQATLPRPTGSGQTMSNAVVPTGGAAAVPTGYRKLGVAGALAGAAGVLFV